MVTQRIAAPEVRDTVLQGFAQVPVVHAPHRNAARREPRIVAAQANDKALRLLLVHAALALHAHAVLENEAQAIHGHRADGRVGIRLGASKNHVHHAVLVPAALPVFDQQVFARAERHLHDFRTLA